MYIQSLYKANSTLQLLHYDSKVETYLQGHWYKPLACDTVKGCVVAMFHQTETRYFLGYCELCIQKLQKNK